MKYSYLFLVFLVFTWQVQANELARTVYVFHSGVHVILAPPQKNLAAEVLKEQFRRCGIPQENLVVLDSPFPQASFADMFPKEGIKLYLDSVSPQSAIAQNVYFQMHRRLQERGIKSTDRIIWVGHSAGGQIGMTMAYLSKNLDDFPVLKKHTQTYQFDMVVTLGTPVGSSLVPPETKVRHYFSPADKVVRLVCCGGPLVLPLWGYNELCFHSTACQAKANGVVRYFCQVDHPDWVWEPRIIYSILRETAPQRCPDWQKLYLADTPGMAFSRAFSQWMEKEKNVCLEDFPQDYVETAR